MNANDIDIATTTEASERQARLWGARADDWAESQEGQCRPLYDHVLARFAVGAATRLLDVGCGSGGFLGLAAARGVTTLVGIDATRELLAIARRRVAAATLANGDIESLPYDDASFDLVTGFNSFQYAASPARALAEASRVVRPGGHVVVATWGTPDTCEAAPYLAALKPFMPPPPPGARPGGPFALSDEAALRGLVEGTGLEAADVVDVACVWTYPDLGAALRGLMSSGPVTAAVATGGMDAVRDAVTKAIAAYRTTAGGYRLENTFRYLVARRPSS